MSKLLFVHLAILASVVVIKSDKVSVGIIHYNDVYGQLFPFKKNSDPPTACDSSVDCVGGVLGLAGHIKKIKGNFSIINLDSEFVVAAGNLISGDNGWLTFLNEKSSWKKHGELITGRAIDFGAPNYYKPNFTTLGPREFDGGISILNTYLSNSYGRITRPLITNLNCDSAKSSDEVSFCDLVDLFRIVDVGDYKIGFIGFVNPKIVHLADPGSLELHNTIDSLKSVVDFYLSDVKSVIAIGSGSLEIVKSIIDEIEKVKLVIYGNENDREPQQGYPLPYKGKYLAKAGMYGSSVGKLVIEIDTLTGNIKLSDKDETKLIEVDNSATADDYWDTVFADFQNNLSRNNTKISSSAVKISGEKENCWQNECSLGDLVTDAMVNCVYQNKSLHVPADLIAVWHSGALGDTQIQGDITTLDVYKFLPYSNLATLVTITGSNLKKMFGQSATALNADSFQWGQFLQVSSGLEVHYSNENGTPAVTSLKAVRMDGGKLKFETVEDSSIYNIVIPSTLYHGRNAYWELPGSFISGGGYADHTIIGAHLCLKNYLEKVGVMKLGLQKRIYVN